MVMDNNTAQCDKYSYADLSAYNKRVEAAREAFSDLEGFWYDTFWYEWIGEGGYNQIKGGWYGHIDNKKFQATNEWDDLTHAEKTKVVDLFFRAHFGASGSDIITKKGVDALVADVNSNL